MQQAFFPALSAKLALFEHPMLWEELMLPSGLVFDAGRCRGYIEQLSATARSEGKLCVYSSERLSGNPHSGGYDAAEMARRIEAVFDKPRILLIFREQGSALQSNYKQYINMGGTCTLEEYLTPPWDGRVPHFRLDNFRYHHLVEYYRNLFGAENLLALPYELLRSDPQGFSGSILDYSGLGDIQVPAEVFEQGVNVSMNDLQLRLKRWANKFSGGDSLHPVKPLAPRLAEWCFRRIDGLEHSSLARNHSMNLSTGVERVVGDYFLESNRRLQGHVGADLSALGYRL